LYQTVGQCGFAMIDMCDNAEVSYIFHRVLKKALHKIRGALICTLFCSVNPAFSSDLRILP
jgi:hypothetical protein